MSDHIHTNTFMPDHKIQIHLCLMTKIQIYLCLITFIASVESSSKSVSLIPTW